MTKKQAKIEALRTLWGWATKHCEGIEDGVLSDELSEDVHAERFSESEAKIIQEQYFIESERIHKRLVKLRKG